MPADKPTVIDADRALARKWYRCGYCGNGPCRESAHVQASGEAQMAAEIAAYREQAVHDAHAKLVEASRFFGTGDNGR